MTELTTFKDHVVQYPERYEMEDIGEGLVNLKKSPGEIYQEGTPLNAQNLNAIVTALSNVIQEFEEYKAGTLDREHPIGSIYASSDATSPADLFGGTWQQMTDKFILAAGSKYTVGMSGGSETVTLTTSQMPVHRHAIVMTQTDGSEEVGNYWHYVTGENKSSQTATSTAHTSGTVNAGGGEAHNNMPPYTVRYVWERIA